MISVRKDFALQNAERASEVDEEESAQPLMISSGGKGSSEHLALLQLERLVPGIRFNLIPFNETRRRRSTECWEGMCRRPPRAAPRLCRTR